MDGNSYVTYVDEWTIRGLGQGLNVYLVEMRIHYTTPDGYEGTHSFPTMYTVGGNEDDALKNAITIHGVKNYKDSNATGYTATVVNADPYANAEMRFYKYPDESPEDFN